MRERKRETDRQTERERERKRERERETDRQTDRQRGSVKQTNIDQDEHHSDTKTISRAERINFKQTNNIQMEKRKT